MLPPLWILGVECFYVESIASGIAKVCACTIGGRIRGLMYFVAAVLHALRQQDPAINVVGMQAKFKAHQSQSTFLEGFVDIIMKALVLMATAASERKDAGGLCE